MSAATMTMDPRSHETAAPAVRPELLNFVRRQVQALLLATPSYLRLSEAARQELAGNVVRVAATAAGLADEVWTQSEALGQKPVVRYKRVRAPVAVAQSAADDFRPAATGQVAKITEQQLRAVAFPTFVADLIRGTFDAIVTSSIREMEAYGDLLANVSRTVEEFESAHITPNQARQWLIERYPEHIVLGKDDEGQPIAKPTERAAEGATTIDWKRELNLPYDVTLDESTIEETLVPAARRRLAETRLKTLATMVLMGVNRIVVTGGKIRATMGFHIDATDRTHAEEATDFDFRHGASGSFGYGPWSAAASMSIAYVRSTRADSDSQLNVETDLTGEVEIHFKSDYFPIQRFADASQIGAIQGNTAVPEENVPVTGDAIKWGKSDDVEGRTRVTKPLGPRKQTLRPGGGVGEPPKMIVPVPELPKPKEAKEPDKAAEPATTTEPDAKPADAAKTTAPDAKPADAAKTTEPEAKPGDAASTTEPAKPADEPTSTTAPAPQPGAVNPPANPNTASGGGS